VKLIRRAHGNGAKAALARVEGPVLDELAAGTPAPESEAAAVARADAARGMQNADPLARREAARALAKRRWDVTRARGKRLALMHGLGLHGVTDAKLVPYINSAIEFSTEERARLARVVGGGTCEGSAALFVDAAALASAASRAAYANGDPALGARLSAEARQNLLGAHELCAREAQARPKGPTGYAERKRAELASRGEDPKNP
jgi:hypothetical protein